MQPYPNPYYYQQPNFGYQQTFQQQPQQNMSSRVVNDFAEITANDVPMDGTQAMFLKRDGSEVQVRFWNANGQIVSTSYKPILEPKEPKVDNLPLNEEKWLNDALERFTQVFDERFSKLERLVKPQRAKKEGGNDE